MFAAIGPALVEVESGGNQWIGLVVAMVMIVVFAATRGGRSKY